jgi:tetratricopeptide (TPR) repeat protein
MIELPTLAVALLMAQGPSPTGEAQRSSAVQTIRPATPGLASAKLLYAAASYEEALTELSQASPNEDPDQVDTYRALCLIALGRENEAQKSLERLLDRNPFHSLSETEVSPRLVSMYRDVRARRLPSAARDLYSRALIKFDEKSFGAAAEILRDLLTALGREDLDGQAGLADLKLLAEGFLRLSENEIVRNGLTPERPLSAPPVLDAIPAPRPALGAAAPAPTSPPASSSPANPGGLPAGGTPAPVIYSQADRYVVGPVEVTRKMPNWNPPASVQRGVYHGLIEVVIDERGLVEKAQVLISVAPTYDPLLIEAAKTWKFRPATLNGDPVKYRRQYEIILHPE